ncbi:glycosyltransferase [Brenneria tiliae]|uniref:glycosyltransferase n=1 Tax=Brenneria tiliae TaxID=2914984 RepID=UPI0020150364|nr:glycosyltransferase [Brenneria tiliae]MCL2899846.1 glycosyltransferase [Brenneria tiliae]MCL2904665.1 glycosyltransferase [Brenneria tiliae]
MPRVLISTNHLVYFGGSEIVTLELVEQFLDYGWQVDVYTHYLAGDIKNEFALLLQNDRLFISADWEDEFQHDYDLLWIQHSTFNAPLLRRLTTSALKTRVIFNHMSSFVALEMPVDSEAENRLADIVLAVSQECKTVLCKQGIAAEKITLFDNPAPDKFKREKNGKDISGNIKNILIVSNHPPEELLVAREKFMQLGIGCALVGLRSGNSVRITPELLSDYDVVITIGKTVQYCFSTGVVPYLYDHFGGEGYLNAENLIEAAHYNFSGRSNNRKLSAEDIVDEIIGGYTSAVSYIRENQLIFEQRWSLSRQLHQLLTQLPDKSRKFLYIPESKKFMQRAIEQKSSRSIQVENKSIPQLLDERVPSTSELSLIQDYLNQNRIGRDIAIFILDLQGNEVSVQQTLASLYTDLNYQRVLCRSIVFSVAKMREVVEDNVQFYHITHDDFVDVLNQVLRELPFDWLMLVTAGERFTVSGLLMASQELLAAGECHAVYSDEIMLGDDGAPMLCCRPDFNLDYLLSLPSVMDKHWFFNRQALLALNGFDKTFAGALEFELIVRLIEQLGVGAIGHLDEYLIISPAQKVSTQPDEVRVLERHLQRRGYPNGKVTTHLPGHYRLQYGHQQQPLVSIIIPTKDQLPRLVACVASLMEKTSYKNYELLLVDNNSETPEAQSWLNSVAQVDPKRIRVLRYPHPFNYSAMNNLAAKEAQGEYLLLLNNDTAVIQADWLDNMLNHALRPEVGIVGAKLFYPDGRIQHGGVVLGMTDVADSSFIGMPGNSAGYMQRLMVDQNYSAVTAACLMIRKSVYFEMEGLDELVLKVLFNDVDLCLKVRRRGYLIVWTPFAQLIHEGSLSQKTVDKTIYKKKQPLIMNEQHHMFKRWLPEIANDPAYSPHLSLCKPGFYPDPHGALSWRPLSWRPLPVVMAHAADYWGCGHYRVRQPLVALKEANLIDGTLADNLLAIPQLARYAPDVMIFQRQLQPSFHLWAERSNQLNHSFKIFELDDYSPNLPLKNIHRQQNDQPKDIIKRLRKSLSFVDRFVVSTQPLAEAFSGLHPDIRVVENRLPVLWWNDKQGLRRQSNKPRVGWGGGLSHTGDLELITDIVRDLADEVEWVFFGMCPEKLRPYVHEFHRGVEIDLYPARLASLNLDLALAPLEDNLFNRCKSNLRLLEYGACGFPVICTDLDPYQGDLPVTRVRNRYKDWMDAIRMHLADLDASAQMGDALQTAVKRDWMLTGDNLALWRKAWLPD